MNCLLRKLFLAALCGFALVTMSAQIATFQDPETFTKTWGGEDVQEHSIEVIPSGEASALSSSGIRLRGRSGVRDGNHYFGVMIPLSTETDLRDKAVVLNARTTAENTEAFYVRFYNQGEKKPAWSFCSWGSVLSSEWNQFRLQNELSLDGLSWEKGVVGDRVAEKIDRVEVIIGTHADNADVSVELGNIRTVARIGTLTTLETPKIIRRETPLVSSGKPISIVLYPDTPAGKSAAVTIQSAIRETCGVTIPIQTGTSADTQPEQAAIVLGSVDSNPAALLLYARKLTPADSICPGPGGAIVHTVVDPFARKTNVIMIGASDDAGLAAAVEIFSASIQKAASQRGDLVLPYLYQTKYSSEFLKYYPWADDEPTKDRLQKGLEQGQSALDRGRHTSIAGVLAGVAQRYRLTGHSVEAKLYVQLWDMYAKSAVADPRRFGGPWGFDSDFPSRDVVPGWDVVEDDPSLTDTERLQTTRHLARWLAEAVVPKCAGAVRSTHVPHNHQTFPALGTFFAGLYFTLHYDVLEGETWLDMADRIFQRQATYFKPYEDCNGYQWLTNGHLFYYALARPDWTIYENGNGRKIIDYCISNMDNVGYQVPYGDTGSWKCWDSETICLDMFAFATGAEDALWTAQWKRSIKKQRPGLNAFTQTGTGTKPDTFNGIDTWKLEEAFFHTFTGGNDRLTPESCYDKISLRESMDPAGLYLLLDGISTGGHKHYDGNSIPRLTQFERIWLADNDYFKSPLKYHNSIMVFKDGESGPISPFCEYLGAGETPLFGYCGSAVSGYAGVDWERYIIWLKQDKSIVALDRLTALEDSEYQFRLLWHGIGEVSETSDGMLLAQDGPTMCFQIGSGPVCTVGDDTELGANWGGYPYAPPVVRRLSAAASVRLKAGERYLYTTVIHGTSDGVPTPWYIDYIQGGDGILLQKGDGQSIGLGIGPTRLETQDGIFSSDAHVLAAGVHGLTFLGVTEAAMNAEPIHTSTERVSVDRPDIEVYDVLNTLPVRPPTENLSRHTNAPAHPIMWRVSPKPRHILLTGNTGLVGAVPGLAQVATSPAPAKENVFDPTSPNSVSALTDGVSNSTSGSLMFEPGASVSVMIDLKASCKVTTIRWQQWWASTSSKKTAYKLATAAVELSNDGFKNDVRKIADITETDTHPDWGTPLDFKLDLRNERATSVRLTLNPVPDTAIYLAELFLYGEPDSTAAGSQGIPYTVTGMCSAKLLQGLDKQVVVSTKEGDLIALDGQGSTLWDRSFGTQLNDVESVDLDGDGVSELMLARQDYKLTLLNAKGDEIWTRELGYYRKPPYVNLVRAGDLDGDGTPEIICGGENWRFYAFDAAGKELWNYEAVHPSRSGTVADLDGDGKAEVLCGTHYYYMTVLNPDGTKRWGAHFGPICWDIDTGAFGEDKRRGVVCGSGDGYIHGFDSDGKQILCFNTGDEVKAVLAADLDGDGIDEIFGGSYSNNLYCFRADGSKRWHSDLGAGITNMVSVPAGSGRSLVVTGTKAGRITTLDVKGQIVLDTEIGAAILDMVTDGPDVLVATERGEILRLQVAE